MDRIKTLQIKIKDGNLSIKNTRQMRTQINTTQREKKTKKHKQSLKKSGKNLMQSYEMIINDSKADLR
jgi:hypothetical protein